jgi:hypothetical protein
VAVPKTLGLLIACVALAQAPVQAGHLQRGSWRWTYWNPQQGVTLVPVLESPIPAAAPITSPAPPPAAAPPAPYVLPAPQSYVGFGRWAELAPVTSNTDIPAAFVPPTPSAAMPAPAVSAPPPLSAPPAPSGFSVDGFVNLGNGPYPQASLLTSGGAQPWYQSPVVERLFGGIPTDAQRADFTNAVLQHVGQTYQQSGVPVVLTADPNVSAAHTISVVSHTTYSGNPGAIGMTDMGNNGFSFVDGFAPAKSVDELEWAVAHNVAHEMMHAFGVDHHDQTGAYLDAATSSWSVLIDPKTVFGPDAVQDLLAHNFRLQGGASAYGAEGLDNGTTWTPQPVPEPMSVAVWGTIVTGISLARRAARARD